MFRNANVPCALLPRELEAEISGDERLLEPLLLCDIFVDGAFISAVSKAGESGPGEAPASLDLEGKMVFPGFVDVHTHLDKIHSWQRSPNRTRGWQKAVEDFREERKRWTGEDIRRRAEFGLKSAWAHGTIALRTHLDIDPRLVEESCPVFAELKRDWEGRIDLQTVICQMIDNYSTPEGGRLAHRAVELGGDYFGGMALMHPELPAQMDRLCHVARDCGVGIDLHVDENGDPSAECLRLMAEAVLRNQFPYPVFCGHCCSLTVQDPERQRETLALVKEAGLNIISLPICNLFLMDRRRNPLHDTPETPHWRGVTLGHEMMESGIPFATASDNVRDAFFAYGDLDMFEVYVQSIRIGHFDTRLADSVRLVTETPARMMGFDHGGRIEAGEKAEMVVFPARNFSELLSRPFVERKLISGEHFRPAELPDYSELD